VPGFRLELRAPATEGDLTAAPIAQSKRCDVVVIHTTLLALFWSAGEVTSDDRNVVATVSALLRSGAVRLRGAFRDCSIECFLD
jgi:hypothetical protein